MSRKDVTWLRNLVRLQHGLDELGALNVIADYEADLKALLDVAEAAKVCVEQSAADNPFVGYGFEALRAALDRLENVAKV